MQSGVTFLYLLLPQTLRFYTNLGFFNGLKWVKNLELVEILVEKSDKTGWLSGYASLLFYWYSAVNVGMGGWVLIKGSSVENFKSMERLDTQILTYSQLRRMYLNDMWYVRNIFLFFYNININETSYYSQWIILAPTCFWTCKNLKIC